MLPFRVGLDVWPALRHPPGIGRWVRELVRALARLDVHRGERPELALFDVGPGRAVLPEAAWALDGRAGVHRVRAAVPRKLVAATGALGFGAERWLGGVDLFQRTFPDAPRLGRVPAIVPVFELPAPGSADERVLARALARDGHALVASAWSRAEVVRRFGLVLERVHAVPIGCEHWLRDLGRELESAGSAKSADTRGPPERAGPARIVVLGALARRRAPLAIVAACERLAREGGAALELELVFAGRAGDAAAEFAAARAASSLGPRLSWRESPAEHELPALVGGSTLLVHLNHEECTAVTPLEALALGVGVVATRLEPFVEALGEHATFVARDVDEPALARAIAAELERATPRDRAARRAHAAAYTWERHARAVVGVWEHVLGR
ncbi:MAG: glycosyltransferase [Planctomycetes bacterium]|nr:glycosyltransferase [Planctomycetota bacterium]